MPTTLNSGLQLPDKGSVDWYGSMQTNYNLLDNHLENTDTHVTAEDKANWNSKQGSLSQAQLDAIAQVATNTSDITALQSGKANASHTHSSSDITDIGDYATKQYVDNSISGLVDSAPNALDTLNELAAALNDDANFATTVTNALSAKANSADLATVATSGSYNDLSNKPTINDSTITIQKNGSLVGTFTVNGSAKTIDIPVPTKTSDLTNDSNFVDTSNSAVASGITSAKVTSYDSHVADTDIHVTTADKTKWNNGVTQSYVFRYSGTAVVPNSTIAYSTIDNTDNIKSGDKILDVDGKLFEITAVDTTNQTVTVGTALIDLALDANVVHTSGNETVGGQKTFTNSIILQNSDTSGLSRDLFSKSQVAVLGDAVSGDNTKYRFVDKNDNEICYIRQRKLTNSNTDMSFCVNNIDNDNNSISAEINFVIDRNNDPRISPSVTDSISLGRPTFRWKSIYSNSYYYGNVEFSTKFVTTDTAQTVSGDKTFNGNTNCVGELNQTAPFKMTADTSFVTGNKNTNIYDQNGFLCANEPIIYNNSKNIRRAWYLYNNSSGATVSAGFNFILSASGQKVFYPLSDNDTDNGSSSAYWKNTYTKKINALEPSSLSLPSDRSARIDISGYITNLGNGDNNSYTVPANGYIWLHFTSISSALCYSQTSGGLTNYAQTFARYSGDGLLYAFFPVRKGDNFVVQIYTSSTAVVQNAYFIPCQGNI